MTVTELLHDALARWPDRVALRVKREGAWAPITFREYGEAIRRCASGLDLPPGAFGAIASRNRPEWHEADLGMVVAGVTSVPIHATSSAAQMRYVLQHAACSLILVEDEAQRAKVDALRGDLPDLECCVVFTGEGCDGGFYLAWDDLLARGAGDAGHAAPTPDDLVAVIYTSGTTGPPKGAMITHANQIAVVDALDAIVPTFPGQRKLSFLPLSHVGERQISEYLQLRQGFEIWFNSSAEALGAELAECRPHVQFVVPRVLEKQYDAVRPLVGQVPGEVLRAKLGYDELWALWSGGAPLAHEVLTFFQNLGVPLHELYGMTEASGPISFNLPDRHRNGTVGVAIPGGELRIAGDGEVLYRGGNVCAGYHRDPEATRELVDAEGWLHTGDVGALDADGFLTLTDRKKDLLITAGGKNVAPQPLEGRLKFSPWISQAAVVGDRRRYVAALLALDDAAITAYAEDRGIAYGSLAELREHPDILALVEAHVAAVNAELSAPEQIKRFRILPEDLTIDSGLLTPTLKVRRQALAERYADLIEDLYS
jgi:long-subunit acyl-CoA synthetase (AMP-forming)